MRELLKKLTPEFLKTYYRNVRKWLQLKRYKGNKVVCPICKSNFREFMPFGLIKRQNAYCPKCESLERHRLLYKYLIDKTDIFNTHKNRIRLLHLAPEKALYDIFASNHKIEYFPGDISPQAYNYNGPIAIKEIDLTNIPFPDNYFDIVLCSHVLEHIPDDRLAMSEIYRVMKKGGWSILQVPIDYKREFTYEDFSIIEPAKRELAFGQHDHVRWYGRDYKERLAKVGLNVTEDNYVKSFSTEDLFRNGLMPSELIYYCTKQ